ncbi:MAG TPA: phage holin family protein [Nocardioidaceae bacterium]|nr:phage holin family protein [Nocardioidaceae bacterium]
MKFLMWVVVNALALGAAVWLLDGITLTGDSDSDKVLTLLGVGLIFGVVNAIVRPVVKLLALPFIILSLGLLIFVINAAMLMLTSRIADSLDLGFHVDEFWWTAILGAIIISIASALLSVVEPDD